MVNVQTVRHVVVVRELRRVIRRDHFDLLTDEARGEDVGDGAVGVVRIGDVTSDVRSVGAVVHVRVAVDLVDGERSDGGVVRSRAVGDEMISGLVERSDLVVGEGDAGGLLGGVVLGGDRRGRTDTSRTSRQDRQLAGVEDELQGILADDLEAGQIHGEATSGILRDEGGDAGRRGRVVVERLVVRDGRRRHQGTSDSTDDPLPPIVGSTHGVFPFFGMVWIPNAVCETSFTSSCDLVFEVPQPRPESVAALRREVFPASKLQLNLKFNFL